MPVSAVRQVKLVVGITGATGVIYGIRSLQALKELSVETHLVITEMGKATISVETDYAIGDVEKLAAKVYPVRDLAAAISSGSFQTDGMIVAPCSAADTLGRRELRERQFAYPRRGCDAERTSPAGSHVS